MDQYSLRPCRKHASEVDEDGFILEEDDTTTPVGYRWLHARCAPKSFLPRHSYFASKDEMKMKMKQYHCNHTVLSSESLEHVPETILDNILWAFKNEALELQVIKMVVLNQRDVLEREIVFRGLEDAGDEDFRRLWFLFEFFTERVISLPDLPISQYPILLIDPCLYVAGPCYHITDRQR